MSRFHVSVVLVVLGVAGCQLVQTINDAILSAGNWSVEWAGGLFQGQGSIQGGEQVGTWAYEDKQGNKRAEGDYQDDKQEGLWTYWFEDGTKETEGAFENRLRQGLWTYWHPGGQLRARGHFDEGREVGEWEWWDTEGRPSRRGRFDDGLQTMRWTFYENGERSAEGYFLENQKVGTWTYWNDGVESQKEYPLDSGLEIVQEKWEDGTTKREGFLVNGLQDGLWITRHRNGQVRMEGSFDAGVPSGTWTAYRADGEPFASGPVEDGRLAGTWTIFTDGGETTLDASKSGPPAPVSGEWTKASMVDTASSSTVLGNWLAEATGAFGSSVVMDAPPESAPAPSVAQLEATEDEPDVPIKAQPWTQRELENLELIEEAYTKKEPVRKGYSSRYYSRGGRSGGIVVGGDKDRGSEYIGKPLALTEFKNEFGEGIDLADYRGQKLVLTILRGFGIDQLCVYCTAQSKVYDRHLDEFEREGAEVMIVFPGNGNELEAFIEGVQGLAAGERPTVPLLYQDEFRVADELNLQGTVVVPSTFILDERGIVRYAYIGKKVSDRPPVEALIEALQQMNANA